jgi:signal transduction histidine kinase
MAFVLWLAVTAVAGVLTARRLTQGITDERASHGRHIAAGVERELENELRRLDRISAVLEHGGDPPLLGAAIQELRLADTVMRLTRTGDVRWTRSVRDGEIAPAPVPSLPPNAERHWRAQPTGLIRTARGARAFLLLPVRESDPEGGAVAAAIVPDIPALASVLAPYRGEAYVVRLVDDTGGVIAQSREAPTAHEPLLVSVAVPRTSWTVQLSQPRAEALAAIRTLQRILVGGSVLLMGVAVLMAWGAARSIRQPVVRLTEAAERLAQGHLETPIGTAGEDEIGRLSHALETLRQALQDDERRSLLLRRVLSVQEDERRRIARELHDQTTQQLTVLGLQLDAAARDTAAANLGPSRELVNTMIDDLHRLIYDLRPSILDDLGLLAAIRSFARTHLEPKGITVHCEFPDAIPELDPDATTAVYRVIQEALTNVMRHARADAVQLACAVSEGALTIEVEDDGVGFDPGRMSSPRLTGEGLGLLGMRERLALLGGRLVIDAAPGSGTRVLVSVPIGPAARSRLEAAW